MSRVYRFPTRVGLADVTPAGRARLDAIARWLQDAAWADVIDSGIEDDAVWIVRRMALDVAQAPRFDEPLELATFCSGVGPLWAERRTEVRGAAGGHVDAVALWVHLDRAGRPRPLPEGFEAIYGTSAGGRRVRARLSHPDPPADAPASPWTFRHADLDMAAHVNNSVYWAVAEEALAGAELPTGWHGEIEHRGPADAGPASVLANGRMRWIVSGDQVVASLDAPMG